MCNSSKEDNKTDKIVPRILVAEDDSSISSLIQIKLRKAGYKIEIVDSGDKVIPRINEFQPDLLILDYMLPNLSGLEIINKLHKENRFIPFIVITGLGDEKIAVEMLKLGAKDYLVKEIRFFELFLPVVTRVIEQVNKDKILEETQKALKESEERYRSLFENNSLGLHVISPDGEILVANPAAVKMLGFNSIEELTALKTKGIKYFPNYLDKEFKKEIEEKGEVKGWESAWIKKDGSFMYIRESAKAKRDKDGKTIHYEGTIEDITQQKRAAGLQAISWRISNSTNISDNLTDLLKYIHIAIGKFIDTTNFYVALYDADTGLYNFPFYIDEHEQIENTRVNLQNSLTDYVRKTKAPLLIDEVKHNEMIEKGEAILVGEPSHIWLGAPLLIGQECTGVIAVQSYNNDVIFTERDLQFLSSIARNIAFVIEKKRADDKLRESEELLSSILESINEGIMVIDKKFRYTYWNKAMERITKVQREELIEKEKQPWEVFSYIAKQGVDRMMERAMKGEIVSRKDIHYQLPNGKEGFTSETYVPLKNQSGEVRGVVGVIQETTEKKLSEAALFESEEKYRLAINATNDGLWDWNVRETKIFYSDRLLQIIGYKPGEIEMTIDFWKSNIHPDDKPKVLKNRNAHLNNKNSSYSIEYRFRNKMGEWIWILSRGKVVERDLEGNALRMLGTDMDISETKRTEKELERLNELMKKQLKDLEVSLNKLQASQVASTNIMLDLNLEITERKLAEGALKESESRYRMLYDSSPNAILVIQQNNYIFANEAAVKMLGYKKESEILSLQILDVIAPEYFNIIKKGLNYLNKGKSNPPSEIRLLKADGSSIYSETSSVPIKIKGKEAILVIGQDITDRKKTEEELDKYRCQLEILVKQRTKKLETVNKMLEREVVKREKAEQKVKKALNKEKELSELKTRFISTASHEFRTPLTAVKACAELLQRYGTNWSEEKYQEIITRIIGSVDYLTELMNDVLTVSRTETGKIKFKPVEVDLKLLCNRMLKEAKVLSSEKHTLEMNYNPNREIFYLDEKLIKFIVLNLLSNAIKYSVDGGKIKFNVSLRNNKLVFTVTDCGIGISEKDRKHLFSPFHRANNVKEIPGTGLGLSIVKKSVDLHKGSIQVKSRLGKGTEFNVYIPANVNILKENLEIIREKENISY